MVLSDEQQACVDSRSGNLGVEAKAGAGKTSMLVAYTKARPKQKILYVAFNQSVKQEAEARFPAYSNATRTGVQSKTGHGLAFPQFGSRYADKEMLVADLRVNQVVEALPLADYPDEFKLFVANAAMQTLSAYLVSDADEITPAMAKPFITPDCGVLASDVSDFTKKLWARMCDLNDPGVGMLHDGYLKLYALTRPTLNFDTILFDEYQDANPVMARLVADQQCGRVVVGDSHQSIYAFRGAVNALRDAKLDQRLYLTRSYRFGQGIADVANLLLRTYKGETRDIIGTSAHSHVGQFPHSTSCAVIARSNASLFDEAIQQIGKGKKVAFVGGIGGYKIGDIEDAYKLWAGRTSEIRSPYLKSFQKFDRMEEYAEAVDDSGIKSLLRVVKKHSSKIPNLLRQVRGGTVEEHSQATVVLTTPHKAKGLEWDNVRLADDFIGLMNDKGQPEKIDAKDREEINIAYVAATRAKRALCPFPDLAKLIAWNAQQKQAEKLPEWARPVKPTGSHGHRATAKP